MRGSAACCRGIPAPRRRWTSRSRGETGAGDVDGVGTAAGRCPARRTAHHSESSEPQRVRVRGRRLSTSGWCCRRIPALIHTWLHPRRVRTWEPVTPRRNELAQRGDLAPEVVVVLALARDLVACVQDRRVVPPPSSAPIPGGAQTSVSSRIRYMAIWRGTTIARSRFWPRSASRAPRRSIPARRAVTRSGVTVRRFGLYRTSGNRLRQVHA